MLKKKVYRRKSSVPTLEDLAAFKVMHLIFCKKEAMKYKDACADIAKYSPCLNAYGYYKGVVNALSIEIAFPYKINPKLFPEYCNFGYEFPALSRVEKLCIIEVTIFFDTSEYHYRLEDSKCKFYTFFIPSCYSTIEENYHIRESFLEEGGTVPNSITISVDFSATPNKNALNALLSSLHENKLDELANTRKSHAGDYLIPSFFTTKLNGKTYRPCFLYDPNNAAQEIIADIQFCILKYLTPQQERGPTIEF